MSFTVLITEVNSGFVTFDNREDAEAFVKDPDDSMVTWDYSETTNIQIVED